MRGLFHDLLDELYSKIKESKFRVGYKKRKYDPRMRSWPESNGGKL